MSEALRLADAMTHYFDERGPDAEEVAAELRRLHAENEQLRHAMDGLTQRCVTDTALIGELVEALRMSRDALNQMWQSDKARAALVVAERALAKVEASK